MRPSLTLVLGVAVIAIGAPGCGDTVIDDVKTEGALKQNLQTSLDRKVSEVDCPSDVEVEAGATFECSVKLADGKAEMAELRIINEDADVEVIDLTSGK